MIRPPGLDTRVVDLDSIQDMMVSSSFQSPKVSLCDGLPRVCVDVYFVPKVDIRIS
jgi:hypothetical protein